MHGNVFFISLLSLDLEEPLTLTMKCAVILSVVIASLFVASEAMSVITNRKTGYETEEVVEPKRSPLTQTWQGKRKALMAVKGESVNTSADTKSLKSVARRSSRSAVRVHDTQIVSSNALCPTWTYQTENGSCECGDTLNGAILCNVSMHRLAIRGFYCMTYNNYTGNTVAGGAGPCIYYTHMTESFEFYHPLPLILSELNTGMCGPLHRTGQLCGQCENHYKRPAYFYGYECVPCDNDIKYNWLKYIGIAFAPLTFFLFVVFCFRISATSAQLNAFVFFSQICSAPQFVRDIVFRANVLHGWTKTVAHSALTFYGFWNLDFFRTLFPGICLDLSFLQVMVLDYAIAFYPLLLMIIFYMLIELHDSNCKLIVYMWKPFNRCLSRFRRQWNTRASTIDAFATFVLLSYVKILSVSIDILCPTRVYDIQGNVVGLYLYYDANVKFFGREHLPYALTALAVLLIFILLPLLLLVLYPMKCCQRCLHCFRIKLHVHALHIFADAFQGCYKDGTDGTRDCRYFAAAYLLVRIILYVFFLSTKSTITLVWQGLAIFLFSISIAAARPYKPKYSIHNATDTVLTLLLVVLVMLIVGLILETSTVSTDFLARKHTLLVLCFITALLPLVYFIYITLHWLKRCITLHNSTCTCCSRFILQKKVTQNVFPDRVVNPEYYSL